MRSFGPWWHKGKFSTLRDTNDESSWVVRTTNSRDRYFFRTPTNHHQDCIHTPRRLRASLLPPLLCLSHHPAQSHSLPGRPLCHPGPHPLRRYLMFPMPCCHRRHPHQGCRRIAIRYPAHHGRLATCTARFRACPFLDRPSVSRTSLPLLHRGCGLAGLGATRTLPGALGRMDHLA